ncbi:glutathione S-transferase [Kosakonia radicincitans DSM 16656]|uniref:glutathione S-transferase family protein n=1 Tax=Kosakonia radicincitans TaxID=283686 RepID=UPI000272F9E9|nr:glutathione S-transferase family protein [Kosakonia radicincitans]APG18126.1 glutathione S-transferase [Kosakonia radicincitans]ARD60788.1 glutathione S-transferase [Kosakonia radicincitans DSM 16656]QEM91598.1 glutathione S-transferase family protein [Kosakonia radicincitans]SES90354.1 GST-like protein [Kosakonia radicincitans]SKC21889.1 GST-like protein [Kosakonia radicincitans]
MITVYGVPGWGSALSEVMLTLAEIPYRFVNVDGFDQPGARQEMLKKLNPLGQVPTLQLDDGSIMTESAAVALMILDQRPDLAPPVGTPERQQFWRLLVWLVANVYPTFTYADYPERWASDAPEQLQENCKAYRKSLYLWLESQLKAAPYAFGESLTLLDIYICVMRTWGPRHAWFKEHTPKFSAIADAVCRVPALQEVLRNNDIMT